ncbi:radical SAM protein [Streptomyces fradiae]|uniref:radical SAM protein n=1 Tax=Streptomyces fradiae TaxID=1906 RepID=UPI0035BE75D2
MSQSLMPSPQAPVDLTALANFAALRGQLRVSLTPQCNIACRFCHNESDVPPPLMRIDRRQRPRRRELDARGVLTVVNAMMEAGLKRVYFTGGEPLLSPIARPVMSELPDAGPDGSYTLITNGTRVRANRTWLRRTRLGRLKVSLHYFSDDSLYEIAQTKLGIAAVLDGIDAALELNRTVELNCLLLKENAHEVRHILDYALGRRLPMQFIELVDTDFNSGMTGSAMSADGIISHLRTLTSDEHTVVAGVGQGRRIFRIDDVEVEVIHRDLGRYHVGQCGPCPKRHLCAEGFWVLRVDHAGGVQPCLLRDDLRLKINHLLDDPAALLHAVAHHIDAFTKGTP